MDAQVWGAVGLAASASIAGWWTWRTAREEHRGTVKGPLDHLVERLEAENIRLSAALSECRAHAGNLWRQVMELQRGGGDR